jgi:exopolysaccharide biosynthesis WecB/TagA/CpsF family protein
MKSNSLSTSCVPSVRLWGIKVNAIGYRDSLKVMLKKAKSRQSFSVEYIAVNNLISAIVERDFRKTLAQFDLILPDGKPIHWVLKYLHGQEQSEHATAREQMLSICAMAVEENLSIYLYGSTETTLQKLSMELLDLYPGLGIAGTKASVFRSLSATETDVLVKEFNDSGAGFIFVALGCPLQEQFVSTIARQTNAVTLCVGSAFEIHALIKRSPPRWITQLGMEWLFRLLQDPQRLWKRYLFSNAVFIMLLTFSAGKATVLKTVRIFTRK